MGAVPGIAASIRTTAIVKEVSPQDGEI
jgi:hypothetical protein